MIFVIGLAAFIAAWLCDETRFGRRGAVARVIAERERPNEYLAIATVGLSGIALMLVSICMLLWRLLP